MLGGRLILCVVCALGLAGCAPAPRSAVPPHDVSHLAAAERLTVYALDPKSGPESWHSRPEVGGTFHGYRVLGAAEVGPGPERARLLEAFQDGLNRGPAGGAACFFPRHGLRAVVGGEPADYLICFECSWVHAYVSGAPSSLTISAAPQAAFNGCLEARGVPLPPALHGE